MNFVLRDVLGRDFCRIIIYGDDTSLVFPIREKALQEDLADAADEISVIVEVFNAYSLRVNSG